MARPPTRATTSVVLAEFADAEAMLEAARHLTDAGRRGLDTYTPYPLKETSRALGLKRSPVPFIVLVAGLTGAAFAYLLQSWVASVDYPLNAGGRPLNAVPAFVPIMFELGVLFGSFGAFFGLLAILRLPELFYPAQRIEEFRSATVSGYWLSLPAANDELESLGQQLRELGARSVSVLGSEGGSS